MLKYQDMWDMPMAGPSDAKKIPHWCGHILYVVLDPLTKVLFRWRVDGREKLRAFQDRGILIVCNHTSFLDVVFIWLAARPSQWVRFMARDNLFAKAGGLLGQIISRIGAFPVARDSADRTAVKRAARMLKDGEAVGIMPEGTRRGKGTAKMQLHAGAAFVAKMGKAPILPMTVRNAEKVKQKGKMVKFPKVTLEFGDPILLQDFDFLPKADRLEGCTWYAMRECFALFYNKPAEQVDMVALFPDARDYSQEFLEHPIPKHTAEELTSDCRKDSSTTSLRDSAQNDTSDCHPERKAGPPCHPERKAESPCHPERKAGQPCHPERKAGQPCHPERKAEPPCHPERAERVEGSAQNDITDCHPEQEV